MEVTIYHSTTFDNEKIIEISIEAINTNNTIDEVRDYINLKVNELRTVYNDQYLALVQLLPCEIHEPTRIPHIAYSINRNYIYLVKV